MSVGKPTGPIGVFDSGVGGLTVLRALRKKLPQESFIYLGDTARLPYGTKSPETVLRYAVQASGRLVELGVKMLVVACNTASAVSLPELRRAFAPLPVVGVVEPGAEAACRLSKGGRILVLGTESTIAGGAYPKAIHQRWPDAKIWTRACPMFVALAEEGWVDNSITEAVVRRYLSEFLENTEHQIDCLVLGCTHFPVLSSAIRKVCGEGVSLVDSAETTADAVDRLLCELSEGREDQGEQMAMSGEGRTVDLRLLATDAPKRFSRVGAIFLGEPIEGSQVELVDL